MSFLLRLQDIDISPIAWELGQNRNQIAGTARALALKRGVTDRELQREDHELAVGLWFAALTAGVDPPRDPEPRKLTTAELRFVRAFLGPPRD